MSVVHVLSVVSVAVVVTIVVNIPTKLNKKQREALKAYAEACGETVDA